MMGWLTEWLKAIILIILFAAFIDLIIPNQSMQRYVKMVVSLFILLTILNPVLQIFHHDFQWEKLQFPESPLDSIMPSSPSLAEIMEEGEKLKAQHEQRSMEMVQQQTERLMRNYLTETMGIQVEQLNVILHVSDEETYIEQVAMMLKDLPFDEQSDSSMQDEFVDDSFVEPVMIQIDLDRQRQVRRMDQIMKTQKTEQQQQIEAEIGKWMGEQWNLSKQQLTIEWLE